MDMELKAKFIEQWKKYFNGAELPFVFYYSQSGQEAEAVKPGTVARCIIGALMEVRQGRSLSFNAASVGCFGGRKYLGFADKLRPEFEYFLSCGIPGRLEGERYKKNPELVEEVMKSWPSFKASQPFIVFKRWDNLTEVDRPEVVVFVEPPDVLSGLFTLMNFAEPRPEAVIAPMGSGCSSIVAYPYAERSSSQPRAVIGMFDPSARPYVPSETLSFALPFERFAVMVHDMDESFLITGSWHKVQKRIPL